MHDAEIERSNGKQAFMLGSGINTLTMRVGPPVMAIAVSEKPVALSKTKPSATDKVDTITKVDQSTTMDQSSRETNIITIPARSIESNINVFTSLLGLQRSISGSLGLPIANVVSITEQLSSSTQSTVNDIFVMLRMRCIEKTVAIAGTYCLKPEVKSRLKSACFGDVRQEFGDSVINSITYGRSALVIIRFHLNSIAEQVALSSSLSTSGPAVVNGSISSTLQKSFASKSYSSYTFLEGMADQSAGIFSSEADISAYIAKLVIDSKSEIDPIPLSISYVPFSTSIVTESLLKRAWQFEQSVVEARILYRQVKEAQLIIDGYLHNFYALDNQDGLFLTTVDFRTQCIDTLYSYQLNFNRVAMLLDKHACNKDVLKVLALEINVLIEALRHVPYEFPETFDLPIKRILVDAIQPIKHHQSEYEFHLNVPTEANTLKFVIESAEQKQHRTYVSSAQMIDKAAARYLVAIDQGIEFLRSNNVAAFAKMKLELTTSMLLLRRVEQSISQIKKEAIGNMLPFKDSPGSIPQLFDSLDLVGRVDVAMTALVSVLTLLEGVQLGFEHRIILSDEIGELNAAVEAIYSQNRRLNEEHTQTVFPARAPGKFNAIKTRLNEKLSASVEILTGDNSISAIKESVSAFFKTPITAATAAAESIDLSLSADKKNSIMDDFSEAERCVFHLLMDKVHLDAELVAEAENDDIKLYQNMMKAAQFYRTASETTSALLQVQKSLQLIMAENGTLTPLGVQTARAHIVVLQSAVDEVVRSKPFVMQPIFEYVVKPHVVCLKGEMNAVQNIVRDTRLKADEFVAPKCSGIRLKLKQHTYSGGFFSKKTSPDEKTIAKEIQSGVCMPVGNSLSHIYLKPTRRTPWLGIFSSHHPAPAEGSSVGVYARVLSNKPLEQPSMNTLL